MKQYRIKGSTGTVKAACMKQAIYKLVDEDGEFQYKNH